MLPSPTTTSPTKTPLGRLGFPTPCNSSQALYRLGLGPLTPALPLADGGEGARRGSDLDRPEAGASPAFLAETLGNGLRRPLFLPALLTLLLLVGWTAAPAAAAEHELALDSDDTAIRFTLGATGHDVEGSLALRQGHLWIDPESGEARGTLEIDPRRSQTGNTKRDKTLHRKVFEVEHHPLITFTAESFEGTLPERGEGKAELHGTLELVGADHPMTLVLSFEIEDGRFTASTHFLVPFVDWGLHDPSLLFLRVQKVVQVEVEAVGSLGQRVAAQSPSGGE